MLLLLLNCNLYFWKVPIEEDNTLIIDNYNKEIGLSIRYRLVVADDALTLLLCLDQDITENYKDLMKSNWSEEVL